MTDEVMMDEAAQRLYLSSMLGNPELFARVSHLLRPTYFDAPLQGAVQFMLEYFQTQRAVPSEPVFHAKTKLTNLLAASLPRQDVQYVAEQIAGFCQTRAVIEAVLQGPELIEARDFGALVERVKLASMIQLHSDLGIDYFTDPQARLEAAEAQEVLIPTGWDTVDEMIGGGVGRQELVLFTANSGGGKSVAMLNMAFNMLRRGLNGVYISLEMRDRVVAKRLDSMISRIASRQLFGNKGKVGNEIELLRDSGAGRFFIKRMREGTTNANHIISYLRELEAVHGFRPDFVVVDYLDLMAPVTKYGGDNMFTAHKFITEEVRAIGFDFDCLMISASQLGRSAIEATREQKSLGQDMIQGGISKINTSDLVIALVKDEAMDAAGEYRFEFLKARNSNAVHKKLTMRWEHDSLRITDATAALTLATPKSKRPALQMPDVRPGAEPEDLQAMLGLGK